MLGLIIDRFILIVLIRLISGGEDESFLKAGLVALLASLALVPTSFVATNTESHVLAILLGGMVLVAVLAALDCFAMLSVPFGKRLLIGGLIVIYTIGFAILSVILFGVN